MDQETLVENAMYARVGRWALGVIGAVSLVALGGVLAMRDAVVRNTGSIEAAKDRIASLEGERSATEAIRDRLGTIDGRLGIIEQRLKVIEAKP